MLQYTKSLRMRSTGIIRLALAVTIAAGCGVSPLSKAPLQGGSSGEVRSYANSVAKDIAKQTGANAEEIANYIASTQGELQELAKQRRAMPVVKDAPVSGGAVPATKGLLTLPISAPSSANTVDVLINADRVFAGVEEAIRGAKYRVQTDLFMLGGRVGSRLAQAMEERRRAGVDVRVVLDPHFAAMGNANEQAMSTATYLRDHQIPVRTFPLDALNVPAGLIARASLIDHNKIVVVDDTAFIGCANLIDVAETNHDLMFRVRGPVAAEISQWVDATWEKSVYPEIWATKGTPQKQELAAPTYHPRGAIGEGPTTQARLTRTDRTEHSTYDRILALLKTSQKISIGVFELDDEPLKAAIIDAKKRGAGVRVLLDRHQMDHKYTGKKAPAGIPNWLAVRDLLAAGVAVKWFDPSLPLQEMHLKMAIFDDRISIVGSTNFTTRAFLNYRETGLELEGGPAVADLVAMFESDWAEHATTVTTMTASQRALAATISFLNKHSIGWW